MKKNRFCPHCGTEFITKRENRKKRLFCRECKEFHYENPIPGVVAIVPDKSNKKILLIKRKIIPRIGFWALPGGFLEKDENATKAIFRELSEETGLTSRSAVLLDTVYRNSKVYGHLLVICFVIEKYEGILKAGDDALEVEFFNLEALPALAFHSHRKLINIYKAKRKSQILSVTGKSP